MVAKTTRRSVADTLAGIISSHGPSADDLNALETKIAEAISIDLRTPDAINPYQQHVVRAVREFLDGTAPNTPARLNTNRPNSWQQIQLKFQGTRLFDQSVFFALKDARIADDPKLSEYLSRLCARANDAVASLIAERGPRVGGASATRAA